MEDGPDLATELAELTTSEQVEKFFEDNQTYKDWIFVTSYAKLEESDLHASYTLNFKVTSDDGKMQIVQSMLKPPSEKQERLFTLKETNRIVVED